MKCCRSNILGHLNPGLKRTISKSAVKVAKRIELDYDRPCGEELIEERRAIWTPG